jgi:hypothetical protein
MTAQLGDQAHGGLDELGVPAGQATVGEDRGVLKAHPDIPAQPDRGARMQVDGTRSGPAWRY